MSTAATTKNELVSGMGVYANEPYPAQFSVDALLPQLRAISEKMNSSKYSEQISCLR